MVVCAELEEARLENRKLLSVIDRLKETELSLRSQVEKVCIGWGPGVCVMVVVYVLWWWYMWYRGGWGECLCYQGRWGYCMVELSIIEYTMG